VQYLATISAGCCTATWASPTSCSARSALISAQLGPTAQLALAALVLALAIAVLSAVATAGRRPALRAVADRPGN
jgi:ABC-type amino acid transport system permease subunit